MIVDISKWNGHVNWELIKTNNGLEGVFIKADTGTGPLDEKALEHSAGAKSTGLPFGFYHYASLNDKNEIQDATLEAKNFIQNLKKLPAPNLPLVLDIEDPKTVLDPVGTLTWIKTFFSELQKAGYKDLVLYSYTPWLDAHLPKNHGLGAIKLWLAGYVKTPKIPYGWLGYWLWQYTNKGSLLGINGNVDLSKF